MSAPLDGLRVLELARILAGPARAAYQAGNPVVVAQVNKAMASNYGSLSYVVQGPWPGGVNQCGSNSNPNNGCQDADDDSNAAYVQALLWYITGDQTSSAVRLTRRLERCGLASLRAGQPEKSGQLLQWGDLHKGSEPPILLTSPNPGRASNSEPLTVAR